LAVDVVAVPERRGRAISSQEAVDICRVAEGGPRVWQGPGVRLVEHKRVEEFQGDIHGLCEAPGQVGVSVQELEAATAAKMFV
jgi:hypothetical protein